ncbi:phage tail sheath subtilisin-like domain-containing protein [Mycetohabitans sp. B2]|nr:phage tail sheath subtilisin-like domain-containing protein [Mycetohabitans sp. B2]MCG1047904.1 phage tail sheath subtilisin-like domain-containing protein [Mycetohabitans sp. B6]
MPDYKLENLTLAMLKRAIALWESEAKREEKAGQAAKTNAETLKKIKKELSAKNLAAEKKIDDFTDVQKNTMTEAGLSDNDLNKLTLTTLQNKIDFFQKEGKKFKEAAEKSNEKAKYWQTTYNTCHAAAQQQIAGPVIVRASAAMAGVIARVDRERGVWKAPANVALVGVTELISIPKGGVSQPIRLDDAINEKLVDKKVNAIRTFRGQGVMVWGACTMAEPSKTAWRYISVRRLFNTVERDAHATLRTMVFEPNNAPTWEAVRSALDHYLFALWRKGALQGETPAQAYFVQIGLGVTMTQDDIDNGRMIIKAGLAAVRPAEFIVLQLTQDMVPS